MAEREFRTTPQWPIATTPLSGDELVEVWKGGKQYYVPFSELGGMPAAHSGTHKHGGDDEVGTLDNLAYEIPKLDADGLIDSRVSDASTTTKGKVQLATDGEEDATKPPTSTDSRLKDARPPTAHAAQHIAGTDVIADATVSNSGLMSAADKVKADATIPAYIPTEDQKAALVGTSGVPSASNPFVTSSDSRLLGGGGSGPEILGGGPIGGVSYVPSATHESHAKLTTTDIAYVDYTNKDLRCYTFDGTGWTQKGNDLNLPLLGYPRIAGLSETDIACVDYFPYNGLYRYTFDGTDWTQKGNGLELDISNNPGITSLSENVVVIAADNYLQTYTFDGTDWSATGNPLSIAQGRYGISAISSNEVALLAEGNDTLVCYTFNGTDWIQKGNGLNLGEGIIQPDIETLTQGSIVLTDGYVMNGTLKIYTFDQTTWTLVSADLPYYGNSYPNVTALTQDDLVLSVSGNGLMSYRIFSGYDSCTANIAADYEVPEIATGKSIVIRRASAYNGNPVTITPPSGATFEGLASLSLYDQYSYVELERISSTVFVIKEHRDSYSTATGTVSICGNVLEQWGSAGPFATGVHNITLPVPYLTLVYAVSGSVTPLGMYALFEGWVANKGVIAIRSVHANNVYNWHTVGTWR